MSATASTFAEAQQLSQAYGDFLEQLQALPHTQRIDEATQAMLYANACSLMQAGRYDSAAKYFRFLVFYVPQQVDYLQGLATCSRQLGDWPAAAQALGTALYLEPASYSLALAWAEALIHVDMPLVASEVLRMLVRLTVGPEDAITQHRAQLLLQAMHEPATPNATA